MKTTTSVAVAALVAAVALTAAPLHAQELTVGAQAVHVALTSDCQVLPGLQGEFGWRRGAGSPYSSRRASTSLSSGVSASSTSTRCQYSAATTLSEGSSAARRWLSFSRRNAERAGPPRDLRICGIAM